MMDNMASDSLGLALLVGDGDDLDFGADPGQLAHQILIACLLYTSRCV